MLGHALQASLVLQKMHDKPGNLRDPDIFVMHIGVYPEEVFQRVLPVVNTSVSSGRNMLVGMVTMVRVVCSSVCWSTVEVTKRPRYIVRKKCFTVRI